MNFISTRGQAKPCLPSEAILKGIASDGGLFVPESWPVIKIDPKWSKLKFSEFASLILSYFFQDDPLQKYLPEICAKAFHFPIPLKKISADTSVLELFHGPTNAFKDFGARFLALATEKLPQRNSKKRLVLVATSGDTGGAVASAFFENTQIPVVILYPKNKVSKRQEMQLTTWGPTVRAIAVNGSFDDCQSLVKQCLVADWAQKDFEFISANSINIGRLLPQMTYFCYASLLYLQQHQKSASFIVPSGNLGNSAALLWAQKLGFPIRKAIFAHNANRAVVDFFETEKWTPHKTIATLANAMDVGNPSNFERIQNLYPKLEDLKVLANSVSVTDDDIKATIQSGKSKWKEIWCPHTATAVQYRETQKDSNYVIVATAHPAKFETIVEPLIQSEVPLPENLKLILSKRPVSIEIDPDIKELKKNLIGL